MKKVHLRTSLVAAALGSALAGAPSFADSSGALEEVVVTAQRRSEKLMDVPMSITAFGQEKLDQQGLRSVDDLTRVAPGVTFLRNGMGSSGNYNDEDSDISIRGVQSSAGASTTGIYVDDTPIQTRHLNFGTVNTYPALFDLERVEVLKGPQGTLFGSGSEGGTIRFITPEASLVNYTGYARAEFGAIDGGGRNYEAGVAVGGPIIENVLGFRISASFREDGGWVDRVNYTPPPSTVDEVSGATVYHGTPTPTKTTEFHANWRDTQTFRLALKWKPSDNVSVDPSFFAQTLHINDTGAFWLNMSDPENNIYRNGNLQRNPSTDPIYVAAVKVTWSLPWAQFLSNTSYYSRNQHSLSDYSQWFPTVFFYNQYSPANPTTAIFTDHQNNLNQEFRLASSESQARLQWTAGLFYTHTNENSTEYVVSPDGAPDLPGNLVYLQPRFSMLDKQYALFGEVGYKVTDTVKVTGGLRYSKLDYTGNVQEIEQGLFGSLNVNTTSSDTAKPLTPRVVINFTPDADSLYYVSAAKGFRPGGINTQLPSGCTQNLPEGVTLPSQFSSDSLWQYEIGSKNTLLDRHLQVSASAYYLKWKNIQQFIYLSCGLGFDFNLGEATGRGGDLQVEWRPTSGLTVGLTAAYTSTYLESDVKLAGIYPLITSSDHLQASPWNLDANLEYVWRAAETKPYLRADYQYATPQRSLVAFIDPANTPNMDNTLPGLPLIRVLALRAGMRFGGYDLSLFVQNALNYHTSIFVSRDFPAPNYTSADGVTPLPNFNDNYFGRGVAPRTIGLTATYKF